MSDYSYMSWIFLVSISNVFFFYSVGLFLNTSVFEESLTVVAPGRHPQGDGKRLGEGRLARGFVMDIR